MINSVAAIFTKTLLRRYTITTQVSRENFEKALQGKMVLYYGSPLSAN